MNRDLFDSNRARDPEPAPRASQRAGPVAERTALTVYGLVAMAKGLLENAYPPMWVSGEIMGWKRQPRTGHCYFTLKDKRAQVRCVMFASQAERLPTDPDEGMEVRVFGTLTLYEQRGDFQLKCLQLEGIGKGGLYRLAFEKLKARLEQEGLLSAERKRRLPRHPATVGVITSPFGAALHDIIKVIQQRAPWTRIVFAPARVQGEGAGIDLARAIRLFERANVADVLIIGRGGGAAEDLWAFNEEIVARAIASSRIPVISAVGHEIDVTIADLVADARAATPSAAAEAVVPDGRALQRELLAAEQRMVNALRRRAQRSQVELTALNRDLKSLMRDQVRAKRERLGHLAAQIDALSPLAALRRGYAVALDETNRVLRTTGQLPEGKRFELRVSDGAVQCRVESKEGKDAP